MKCQKVTRTTKTCNNQCGEANKNGRKKCTQPVRVHKHTCRHNRKRRAKSKWIKETFRKVS